MRPSLALRLPAIEMWETPPYPLAILVPTLRAWVAHRSIQPSSSKPEHLPVHPPKYALAEHSAYIATNCDLNWTVKVAKFDLAGLQSKEKYLVTSVFKG